MSEPAAINLPAGALKRGIGLVRRRFKGRTDSEHEQATVRIVIVAILALYFLILDWVYGFEQPRFTWGLIWAATYLAISMGYVAAIVARPAASPIRRLTAMVTDLGTLSILMYWGQESGTPLYPIYLWITFGNGFRYGNRYLGFGRLTLTTCLGFGLMSIPDCNVGFVDLDLPFQPLPSWTYHRTTKAVQHGPSGFVAA